jgi:hypothetical protein
LHRPAAALAGRAAGERAPGAIPRTQSQAVMTDTPTKLAASTARYNVAEPKSLANRLSNRQQRKMYRAFLGLHPAETDTILDVGVASDRSYDNSNYLEAWYPHKHRITAVGLDDASFLETAYPGLRFVRADGLALPFPDGAFDYAHAGSVIEHVGSRARQARLIAELRRVARKGIFATTPNRWFPVEVHTLLPLVHWLPPAIFRRALRALGHDFFSREENLNLLSARDARTMVRPLLQSAACQIRSVRFLGYTSNLLLIIRPPPHARQVTTSPTA